LDFTSAKRNDARDANETAGEVRKGDLVVRDLGYFSSPVLAKFAETGAFYLSRLKSKMEVFDGNGLPLSFRELYTTMARKGLCRMHMAVTIGQKQRLPVRLVIETVPEEVYSERIRKREAENKKKGQAMSEEFKTRARFNLMVTNVPEEDLPVVNVYDLYKMRWQVELLFKTWKSTLGIHKVHAMRCERLVCLMYAKLLLYIAAGQTARMFSKYFYITKGKHLSIQKCLKTLIDRFATDRSELTLQKRGISSQMKEMAKLLSRNHWLEERKGRVGFVDSYKLFTCVCVS